MLTATPHHTRAPDPAAGSSAHTILCDAPGSADASRLGAALADAIGARCDAVLFVMRTPGQESAVLAVPRRLQPHVRPETWSGRTIVCGYDGSPGADCAASAALSLSVALGGRLELVTVDAAVDWRLHDVVTRLRREAGWDAVGAHVRTGDPAWELARVANALTAPFIAIGARGRGPEDEAPVGPVARQLLRSARHPLLVVPAAASAPPAVDDGSWPLSYARSQSMRRGYR